jgi:hypothetical protein
LFQTDQVIVAIAHGVKLMFNKLQALHFSYCCRLLLPSVLLLSLHARMLKGSRRLHLDSQSQNIDAEINQITLKAKTKFCLFWRFHFSRWTVLVSSFKNCHGHDHRQRKSRQKNYCEKTVRCKKNHFNLLLKHVTDWSSPWLSILIDEVDWMDLSQNFTKSNFVVFLVWVWNKIEHKIEIVDKQNQPG